MTTVHFVLSLAFVSIVSCCSRAQEKPAEQAPDAAKQGQQLAGEMKEQFEKEKIAIDLKAGTVTIPAVVIAPPDALEYLLIHRKGKKHEALLYTESKPSILNAALLLLGLEPGKNATFREKTPPPTLEEIEAGADPIEITEPSGTEFFMTVKWKDDQGKPVECCVEDLVADIGAQAPLENAGWIFLGGRMAALYRNEPEVYVADFEGNIVSLCYLTPDNHLGTMKHARARDDENWTLTEKVPARGTEVQFTFHKQKSELHTQREKRLAAERKEAELKESKKDEPAPDAPKKDGGR
ncbi:MAG: YdjY domain-containing protein [Planctomycetota bacterium]